MNMLNTNLQQATARHEVTQLSGFSGKKVRGAYNFCYFADLLYEFMAMNVMKATNMAWAN
jgi:hypothetical protein